MIFKHELKLSEIYFAGYVWEGSLDCLDYVLRNEAASDSDAIVLFMRSRGGYITKVPETAKLIEEISKEKPIIAYTDTIIASAAYWLVAGCDRIYAAPSSEIGSIGVYAELDDWGEWNKKHGVNKIIIRAKGSPRKARTSDGEIDDEEIADIQASVDKSYDEFTGHILKHRKIDSEYLQGKVYEGNSALKHGFIDGLADSYYSFRELISLTTEDK